MTKIRARSEQVRRFILENVEKHPAGISKLVEDRFGVTRQAANKHLKKLVAEGALTDSGKTRAHVYQLCSTQENDRRYRIVEGLAEHDVWRDDLRPALGPMPDNVLDIWHHGFTEMFNNALDHSGGAEIVVRIRKTAVSTEIMLLDDGMGIFKKIQSALGLLDERHAIFELSKGKLTTDPDNHSGEGIFFTSRMFDAFDILSGGVFFTHKFGGAEDWLLENEKSFTGTAVWMKLSNHTARTTTKIFDQFASGDDYAFNKTVVPVKLAQYGNDKLISRSQAKRLLARIELFKVVLFDFTGVEAIGQAFADEIFRVFANAHPEIELTPIHANSAVKRMISRAKGGRAAAEGESTPIA